MQSNASLLPLALLFPLSSHTVSCLFTNQSLTEFDDSLLIFIPLKYIMINVKQVGASVSKPHTTELILEFLYMYVLYIIPYIQTIYLAVYSFF